MTPSSGAFCTYPTGGDVHIPGDQEWIGTYQLSLAFSEFVGHLYQEIR